MSASFISRLCRGKLDMEVVLNATLAGGVAMGAAADLIDYPFCSMIVGFVTGGVSSLGFLYLGPYLNHKINMHDTCGVHNLHGIPGIIGGLVSAISAGFSGINFGEGSIQYNSEFVEGSQGRSSRE